MVSYRVLRYGSENLATLIKQGLGAHYNRDFLEGIFPR